MSRQRLRDLARNAAGQVVVNGLPRPPGLNEALAPQDAQMLGNQGLLYLKFGSEAANALISLNEPADDHETMRVRQRPQQITGIRRSCRHVWYLYLHTCVYARVRIYCQHRTT